MDVDTAYTILGISIASTTYIGINLGCYSVISERGYILFDKELSKKEKMKIIKERLSKDISGKILYHTGRLGLKLGLNKLEKELQKK